MTDQIVKLGNIRKGTQKMSDPSSGRVYSGGGICQTILARDYKEPKLILEVRSERTNNIEIRQNGIRKESKKRL